MEIKSILLIVFGIIGGASVLIIFIFDFIIEPFIKEKKMKEDAEKIKVGDLFITETCKDIDNPFEKRCILIYSVSEIKRNYEGIFYFKLLTTFYGPERYKIECYKHLLDLNRYKKTTVDELRNMKKDKTFVIPDAQYKFFVEDKNIIEK